MNSSSWLKFTAGERRGMVVILLIMVVILVCIYLYSPITSENQSISNDSTSVSLLKAIDDDTVSGASKKSKTQKRNKKTKRENSKGKGSTRNPLSEPLPIEKK